MQETWVQSLGWEGPLEEGMAIHSSILSWRILTDYSLPGSSIHGVTKSWTWLSHYTHSYTHNQGNALQKLLVEFCHSVMSDSLWPHELQHTRPTCPSSTPGAHPNSCPLSWWCQPTISSSIIPFSSCPQSFPISGSFQMSQFFAWPKYWEFQLQHQSF